ncbi:hypothetical protein LCGC14_2001420, partial [marine sediment metagenome]
MINVIGRLGCFIVSLYCIAFGHRLCFMIREPLWEGNRTLYE